MGMKDCFGLENCRSKAAYLRGGSYRFSKLVSLGRANDIYKGIVHRSSFH